MPSQRILLGAGVVILLIITAASIGLDLKSRSDTAWVRHSLEVQNRISELQLLLRRAESASRGFALHGDAGSVEEFQAVRSRLGPAVAGLERQLSDNPEQSALLAATAPLIEQQLQIEAQALQPHGEGDEAVGTVPGSKTDGRAVMEAVSTDLERLAAAEERLLGISEAESRRSGIVLLGIDIAGAVLIVVLLVLLLRVARRRRGRLETLLGQSQAAKAALEAAVAERTEHLVRAQDETRLSVAVLQSTFRSLAEAVLVIDSDGEILLSNPAAETMLRYERGMRLGDLRDLSHVFQRDGVTPMTPDQMPSARVLRGDEFDEQEILVRPRSGAPTRHLLISGRPLRDAAGAISGGALVYHDATASRETERQLREAQKLDAIGKLTGGVAHDFNNMLTVIAGNTERLVSELKDRPQLLQVARLIDDAAERCSELVRHLLAFARKQPLYPRNVDVNAAITDIAKLLRPTLGEHVQIEAALCKDVITAHIDPSQLANAIINMALNARDAMPGGGKLLLETANVALDEAYAAANPGVHAGPYVMVAVSDTGSGMAPEVMDKAFEPFFTTKEVGKGSGLGLSMVYGFVKQSGGHIKLYSEQDYGTSIKLYLPPGTCAAESAAPAASPPPPRGSETILVVEDDALVRNYVIAQLASLGYAATAVANARAALDVVERGEPFDLLFTDIVMPGGMNGRQLAAEVARRRPGTPVLYTSGYSENAPVQDGKTDDGALLLGKPYRRVQLADMIRRALGANASDAREARSA